jgi:hypothetical protein
VREAGKVVPMPTLKFVVSKSITVELPAAFCTWIAVVESEGGLIFEIVAFPPAKIEAFPPVITLPPGRVNLVIHVHAPEDTLA